MVRLVPQPIHGSELLAQYRQTGAPELFAQIMRAYGGMVFSVCLKVTKDAADAEDASQAAFLTLAVQCKTGATISYLGPWLKKVAKRSALDLVRSKKRRTKREAITAGNRPDAFTERAGGQAEQAELSAIIRHELDQLPAKYRMPLVLHYFGGLSHEAIAAEMKCTTAALGVRLHRARKMLGKRLEAKNISLEGAALGAAIALAVTHVVSERFIHNTTLAVMTMNAVHVAGVPTAGLPAHLGAVASLVAEVGQSMARARMKMAALAIVGGITMLGGAAEATNYLPQSLRTSLNFLAPSNLLHSLIRALTPTPTMRLDATPPAKTSAPVTLAKAPEPTREYVPAPATIADPPTTPLAVNQPILALQVPPMLPPVVSTYLAMPSTDSSFTNRNYTPAKTVTLSAAPAVDVTPVSHTNTGFQIMSVSSSGSSHADTSALDFSGGGGSHEGTAITEVLPPSALNTKTSQDVEPPSTIGPLQGGTVAGNISGQVTTTTSDTIGPVQVGDKVPDSVVLGSNGVFVHSGTGTYHWGSSSEGITAGGTNSADFTLDGVVGDGVVTISRLPVTTELAPARPTGHHFVGIWSIDSTVDYSSITLTAHYDEAFAEALNLQEDVLKLWVYDKGQWIRIMDSSFYRDMVNHTLTGTYDGMPTFFAVSAPEPAAALIVLGSAAFGMLKRRRTVEIV